jgi:hypothetical protein
MHGGQELVPQKWIVSGERIPYRDRNAGKRIHYFYFKSGVHEELSRLPACDARQLILVLFGGLSTETQPAATP